jgi:polar amino acid transport system substrate-binding protein
MLAQHLPMVGQRKSEVRFSKGTVEMAKSNTSVSFFTVIIVAAITAAIVSIGFLKFSGSVGVSGVDSITKLESVKASGKIRCGYVPYPPGLIKDPNSGEISGIFPEVLELAAENIGLKIEWVEEVGWGTMVEGLVGNRYDMIGSPVWPTSQRVTVADFTQPIFYSGAEAYVRVNDNRFDEDLGMLNDPKFKIAITDGEATEGIAKQDFPKAGVFSLPQLSDISQLLLSVADGKADVTFVEPQIAFDFMQKNPEKIKRARPGKPLRLYPNTMMVRQSDDDFRRALNLAIAELENSGVVDQILAKYEAFPGAFYRNAAPIKSDGE